MSHVEHYPGEALAALNEDTSRLFVVFHLAREGAIAWAEDVEKSLYTPGTPANREYEFLTFGPWPDEGLMWGVAGVPLQHRSHVERFLEKHNMRLANGTPHVFNRGGKVSGLLNIRPKDAPHVDGKLTHTFPLTSPRTFTLENRHKVRGPVASTAIVIGPSIPGMRPGETQAFAGGPGSAAASVVEELVRQFKQGK